MKKMYFLLLGVILWACNGSGVHVDEPLINTEYPDITKIEIPENKEAARMLDEYLSVMDSKMELASQIGRISIRDQYVREVFIDIFSDPDLDPNIRAQFQKTGGQYVKLLMT